MLFTSTDSTFIYYERYKMQDTTAIISICLLSQEGGVVYEEFH